MTKKNNQIILTSRIVTIALVTFAAVNGIFSTKLNAKAIANNANNSTSHDNDTHNANTTLVSANYHLTHKNASSNGLNSQLPRHYYNHKVNNITSNILLSHTRYNSKAAGSINNIEASSVASTVHKHSEVRSSFTSSGNYYHSLSDVTSVSSSAQPGYTSHGASSGINKKAIQNRYPAEFQSLNNVYQHASMQVTISKSKASNANHYLSAYESLNNRNYQDTFSWHHKSIMRPNAYQHHLKYQYQQLSSTAARIFRVSAGLDNANYLAERINQMNDPLYRNMMELRTKDDAESLTSINQSLAYNNQKLSSANHALNDNHKNAHKVHIERHLMNLDHNSVWDQAFKDHAFINQVSGRGIPYNKTSKLSAHQIFRLVINNLAHNLNLNDLNNINDHNHINNKYQLLHSLYLKNIVIYADQNGNLINITNGNQPVNINQRYAYAFPLYNTDYSNFVSILTDATIKLNYSSFNSNNTDQANQIKQRISSISSRLEPLKATNQLLTKKEDTALNQWKLDSFLLSKPSQPTVFKQFYNTYLDKIINIDNQIYYGALGIGVYLFDPSINSFKLLIEKGGKSGTNLQLNSKDLNQIKRNVNHNYEPKTSNKYENMFQPNNIVLPNSIFKFLKSHNYRLANGQSILRNIVLCSVKFKKETGNLNLFIKFRHCNSLNELNSLSDYNDLHEMIPILHDYYPLGNQEITTATKSILNPKVNDYNSLKRGLYSASNAVNVNINKYQASLSNFVNYSSINKELASAKYFASSYSSEIKSNQDNVSLAEIELDNFYVSHAPKGTSNSNSSYDNHSSEYQNWQHIPQYIHVNSGLPIYNTDHRLNYAKENATLRVIGIGTDHNGRVFYKVNNNHKRNYVPADSRFITNAYYPIQSNVTIKVLHPIQAYRDANLTVPYKTINVNTHLSGQIKSININSEKTVFKSKDGNYLPADTQHIKIIK